MFRLSQAGSALFSQLFYRLSAEQRALGGLFSFALILRLATLGNPSSYFPDEIFQYLDVAHALVFGYGVETWEQRYGIRSPLFPLFLAVPMQLGQWLSPNGFAFLAITKAVLALCALGTIWGAYGIGRVLSPIHGLFAGFVAAIWFELVYFSTQALTEAVALSLFFPAAALLLNRSGETGRRLFAGGFLLAAAALLRFQYGPALLIFGVLVCGLEKRRWIWAGSGAMTAALLSAAIDLSQGITPYSWLFANYYHNISLGRSHAWTDGPEFYLFAIPAMVGPWIGIQLVLAWFGSRSFAPLAIAGLANVVVHSLVAHKEYRYVLLSTAILLILAAIGTVTLVLKHTRRGPHRTRTFFLAGGLWLCVSVASGTVGPGGSLWSVHRAELRLFQSLHRDPGACGVAIFQHHWSETGGYSYLHRRIPMYVLDKGTSAQKLHSSTPSFNRLIAPAASPDTLGQFTRFNCEGTNGPLSTRLCIYRRAGSCDQSAAADLEINQWLKDRDF